MIQVTVRAPIAAVEWVTVLLNLAGMRTQTKAEVVSLSDEEQKTQIFPTTGDDATPRTSGLCTIIHDDQTRETMNLLNEMHTAVLAWASDRLDPWTDQDFTTLLAYGIPPVWLVDATLDVTPGDTQRALTLARHLMAVTAFTPHTRLLFSQAVLPLLDRVEEAIRNAAGQGN